jgi:hypothetical protein
VPCGDNNPTDRPFQIEFSQRGEWDLGTESATEAWAEFYDGFETKYYKHPFYYPCEQRDPVEFDVCQMIDQDETLVGFAAFWPNLISKWVTNVDSIDHLGGDDIPGKLETMETEEKYIDVPDNYDVIWPNYLDVDSEDNLLIDLMDELVEYPRGACEWSDEPWVFKLNEQGTEYVKMVPGIHWEWGDPFVIIGRDYWVPGDKFAIVYKRFMKGHEEHEITPLECNELPADEISYGMLDEPRVPYVFAEWDFDLDYDHPENSTQQFRCVSVYGLTDYNNAIDPDMPDKEGYYRIDSEVQYLLNEIFNPWDLKDAAHKDTFRWAQKGTIEGDDIILASHLHDKYGNDRDCLDEDHGLVQADKWGYYCHDDEKVILYDSTGTLDALLLTRPFNYTINNFTVTINDLVEYADYDLYKVLYSTELLPDETREEDWSVGRWEWIVVGEPSLASDSIGTGMVAAAWLDWKNVETWLSGLDMEASVFGPSIPYVLRPSVSLAMDTVPGDYKDDLGRAHFKDDWSTPDDWAGEEIYPYAISSSNIIVVGGPLVNVAAEYFNDFTDAFVFSEYGEGFYAPGCWARTSQPYWELMDLNDVPADELWYDSMVIDDDVGYAIVAAYKDLNETKGFVIYGLTAEDTYYACYALRGGGLEWLQYVQPGVTAMVLRIEYDELHPVSFHVEEELGVFTECTGAYTNFKTSQYYDNYEIGKQMVLDRAAELGICYKLVDIDKCAQVHPDP